MPDEPSPGLVLVIDDEPLVRSGLRRILQLNGYAVVEAADGRTGLAVVEHHPELCAVILDVTMPGLSGLDVLDELRAMRPHLPVVLSTAADVPAGRADGFLAKPYRPEALLEALEAAISAKT